MQSESVAEFASCNGLEDFSWSHETGLQGLEQRIQRLGQILSLADLSQKSQIYMPLTAPSKLKYAVWPQDSLYHKTALCSAFLDTATLPFRTSNNTIGACSFQTCLASMVSILNPFFPPFTHSLGIVVSQAWDRIAQTSLTNELSSMNIHYLRGTCKRTRHRIWLMTLTSWSWHLHMMSHIVACA